MSTGQSQYNTQCVDELHMAWLGADLACETPLPTRGSVDSEVDDVSLSKDVIEPSTTEQCQLASSDLDTGTQAEPHVIDEVSAFGSAYDASATGSHTGGACTSTVEGVTPSADETDLVFDSLECQAGSGSQSPIDEGCAAATVTENTAYEVVVITKELAKSDVVDADETSELECNVDEAADSYDLEEVSDELESNVDEMAKPTGSHAEDGASEASEVKEHKAAEAAQPDAVEEAVDASDSGMTDHSRSDVTQKTNDGYHQKTNWSETNISQSSGDDGVDNYQIESASDTDHVRREKIYKTNEDLGWLSQAREYLRNRAIRPVPETKYSWQRHDKKPTWVGIASRHTNTRTSRCKPAPKRELFIDRSSMWLKMAMSNLTTTKTNVEIVETQEPIIVKKPMVTKKVWLEQAKTNLATAPAPEVENDCAGDSIVGSIGWLLGARKSLSKVPTSRAFNPCNEASTIALMEDTSKSESAMEIKKHLLTPPPKPDSTQYCQSYIAPKKTKPFPVYSPFHNAKHNVTSFISYIYSGSLFRGTH